MPYYTDSSLKGTKIVIFIKSNIQLSVCTEGYDTKLRSTGAQLEMSRQSLYKVLLSFKVLFVDASRLVHQYTNVHLTS